MRAYDQDDLLFQLFDVAKAEALCQSSGLDRATITGILETADQIATDHFLPHGRLLDEQEPKFVDGRAQLPDVVKPALDAYAQAGFIASGFKTVHGGMALPETLMQAVAFIFAASNIALAGYGTLTIGAGRLIQSFGSADQQARYLPAMISGRAFGTMCLSEPQAGSSLADITTRAEPLDDGRYRIKGRKMWISGGDHDLSDNIIHLVLAKIPGGPAGVKGISLFIVPKRNTDGSSNDVTLAGLNHKMGYRGITNCALNFGDDDNCYGELLGEPHKGLSYMFQMMNEARIGVGLGATALGQAGYQVALSYAKDRPQGRSVTDKDPQSPQVPIIAHADVRRLLVAQKAAVEPALALALYCASLVDQHRAGDSEALALLDVLTPVAKSWPSEFCLEANKHAIQVLGGAGYTRQFPAERLYRDNRLNHIHEGTHGIQGLDILRRKMLMNNGAGASLLSESIRRDIAKSDLAALGEPLLDALQHLEMATAQLAGHIAENPERGLSNATLYLDCVGHVVMAWMWLRICTSAQAKADTEGHSAFTKGKLQSAEYFYARELPRVQRWSHTLSDNDQSAFDMQQDWF